ncbi:MAG: Grx4 family monothiol glutaredoxin [Rickettsiaceae bacterium]
MTQNKIFDFIRNEIKEHEVVLFMKGTADFPKCGFSAMVISILRSVGVKFKDHDVLENEELRQGIKDFSDWPTIPQLYIKGEFVGGCDIVREMYENGSLSELVRDLEGHGATPHHEKPSTNAETDMQLSD